MSFEADVYQKLSEINVNKLTEKKGGFTYLSWANALKVLMENYPASRWKFQPVEILEDGTGMVRCELTIVEGIMVELRKRAELEKEKIV